MRPIDDQEMNPSVPLVKLCIDTSWGHLAEYAGHQNMATVKVYQCAVTET